jgi:hypothetical protein
MEEEESSSESDGVITPSSDRNATRAARRKAKQPLLVQKNGKSDKGKAPASELRCAFPLVWHIELRRVYFLPQSALS